MNREILNKFSSPKPSDSFIIDLECISTDSSIDSIKSEVISKNMCNSLQKKIDSLDSNIYNGKKNREEI